MDSLQTPDSTFPARQPGVILWFKLYCGLLCLTYLALASSSLIFFLFDPSELGKDPVEATVMGCLFLVLGVFFFVVSLLPFFLRPRPWVWVYDLVIIVLGLTSACFIPLCVPLLIFWIKPETKAWFDNGR